MEALTNAIHDIETLPTPPLETMFSIVISTVAKDADFSQNDLNDAFEIFMNNPRVAETYAAITNAGMRSYFLSRCLCEFQIEKFNGIRKD
jgi:hypothetical protein